MNNLKLGFHQNLLTLCSISSFKSYLKVLFFHLKETQRDIGTAEIKET
jgi:hypothetical protein